MQPSIRQSTSGTIKVVHIGPLGTYRIDPHRFAATIVIAAIIVLCALGPFMTAKPVPFTGDGSPQRQMAYAIVFMLAIYAAQPFQGLRKLFVIPAMLCATLLWFWISLSWSIAPFVGLRRLMLTTIIIISIFTAVTYAGHANTTRTIRGLAAIILVLNFLAVFLYPEVGVHQPGEDIDASLTGDWRGIMLQKNFAGAMCAFTALSYIFDTGAMRRSIRFAVLSLCLVFLYFSGSKTSLGIFLLSAMIGGLFLTYDPRYRAFLPPLFCVTLCALAWYVSTHWHEIIAPYYQPDSFTGRTQIWAPVLAYANDHLLTGAGFGSFWNIGFGQGPIFDYAKGWILTYAAQGHNGYLDILVTTGLPGLILTILSTFIIPVVRLLSSRTISRQTGAMLLSFIIFAAGHNLTESSLMDRDTIVQVFLLLALALTQLALKASVPQTVSAVPMSGPGKIDVA